MPKAKYEQLYQILKGKIESGEYPPQELLPSEHMLIAELDCSRNTLRRAVGELVREGYVQTMQGKGVRNIFEPARQATFTLGTIETFAESAARNHWRGTSEILDFAEVTADDALADTTGFTPGTPLYYVQRLHYLNGQPLIMNHSYCLAVVSSQTYNSDGVMFEYTQSRHHPDYFRFQDNAVRRPGGAS